MEEVVLHLRYPAGQIPARGFRCAACGEENLLASDGEKANEMAHDLGLYGLEQSSTRRLLRAGNSVAVTLDPQLVKDLLHGVGPGTPVRVGRLGSRIFIEPLRRRRT